MHRLTPSEAAAEIAALINSKPASPRLDEIEAIIAKSVTPVLNADQARLRAEWDALLAAANAAEDAACLAAEGDNSEEADAVSATASTHVDECARRIIQAPVHGLDDIKLLAEVLHWHLWSDLDGITDESLAAGPSHDNDKESDEALAALLKGVRDMHPAAA